MATEPAQGDGRSPPGGKLRERLTRFVRRARERASGAKSAFAIHGITFACVNGMLLVINLATDASFLWSLIPLGGWGIGLLQHFTEVRARARDARDAASLPPAASHTLRSVLKLFANRRSLRHHLTATASVSAFMVGLNIAFAAGGPWAMLAISPLAAALGIRYGVSRARRRRLLSRLRDAGVELSSDPATALNEGAAGDARPLEPPTTPMLAQAVELRDAILADLHDGGASAARWRQELQPELDGYTDSIRSLLQARSHLEQAAARVSAAEVTGELEATRAKLEATASPDLRRQYQAAIDQYGGQLRSLQDLQEQVEMIDLRAKSALLALQQLALDIPRLRTTPAEASTALSSLRNKSHDLNRYLHDLRAGFDELDREATATPITPPLP